MSRSAGTSVGPTCRAQGGAPPIPCFFGVRAILARCSVRQQQQCVPQRASQARFASSRMRLSRPGVWRALLRSKPNVPRRADVIRVETLACAAFLNLRQSRTQNAAAWPQWLQQAENSPLASFARRLRRDQHAVLAALELPWSNGTVEGQIHRLKLLKRQMYGRAGFDLLKLRVLHAA